MYRFLILLFFFCCQLLFAEAENGSSLEDRLKNHIRFESVNPNVVGRIVIDDRTSGINTSTWLYVRSALDAYKKSKPIFIILELNTPGGEVFAAQQISDALKEMDTQYNIPVVAFINNWAISAGAMLAYSCRFIAIVKDASMGAAEPVITSTEGLQTASEKINSAFRADLANRAAFFGRNPILAEAMVDKDIIVVLRKDKIVKLDKEEQVIVQGPDPDTIISPKGKLLTLNAQELMKYGVADLLMEPTRLDPITPKERADGKWVASKELLFHQPFFDKIPSVTIETYAMDWKTRFFSWLSHPVVSSLLFMGLLVGFYIEMNTPGFGLAGGVALGCLILILLSSFALQAVSWFEVILLVGGVAIIIIDLLFLPTFGILGSIGLLLALGGLFALMLPGIESIDYDFDTQTFNAAGEFAMRRLVWLCAGLLASVGVIALLAKYVFPKLLPFSRFILAGHEQESSKGYVAGETNLPSLGAEGEAISTLRPGGKVVFNGKIYDAFGEAGFIDKGAKVVVVRVMGSEIYVVEKKG